MRRQDFIGSVVAAWRIAACAQGKGRIPRVGVLWHSASAEEEGPDFRALFEVDPPVPIF